MYGIFGSLFGGGSDEPQSGSFYALKGSSSSGEEILFERYRGQVVLIVNTASKCGFTGQYDGLEKLYETHREGGLVVLGFPSNDFMGQEPGSDEQIQEFCKLNYGVSFPLFKKGPVTGEQKQPVFKFLTDEAPGKFRGKVLWNFEKFLINRSGEVVGRWRSVTGPSSSAISDEITKALSEPQ
jgi:glutathione peroxidase